MVGMLAASLWIFGSALTAAGADVFTVDMSQSRVSVSGNVMGSPIREQAPGSLTTQYGGTLLVDVGSNTIQFPGSSQVVAFNSGNWQPRADGNDGSEPANYGGTANFFFSTGLAAVREIQVDVTSGALAVSNGSFDTTGITIAIPAGAPSSMAYRVSGSVNASGVVALGGHSATGQAALGSLTVVGSQLVLTIPMNYVFYYSIVDQDDTTVVFTGQLVATRSL